MGVPCFVRSQLILDSTAKLRRCIAVLYRLCAVPECAHFLEAVDKTDLPDYEYLVRHEMSLRKVRENLAAFVYRDHYQFATDIRLCFYNGQHYNGDDSEASYYAAEALKIFEKLFLDWVVNTANKVGKGPWDAWFTMRYFDIVDDDHIEGFCERCDKNKYTHPKSNFSVCSVCEDNFCETCVSKSTKAHPTISSGRVCPRCEPVLKDKVKLYVPPPPKSKKDKQAGNGSRNGNSKSSTPPKKRKVDTSALIVPPAKKKAKVKVRACESRSNDLRRRLLEVLT